MRDIQKENLIVFAYTNFTDYKLTYDEHHTIIEGKQNTISRKIVYDNKSNSILDIIKTKDYQSTVFLIQENTLIYGTLEISNEDNISKYQIFSNKKLIEVSDTLQTIPMINKQNNDIKNQLLTLNNKILIEEEKLTKCPNKKVYYYEDKIQNLVDEINEKKLIKKPFENYLSEVTIKL